MKTRLKNYVGAFSLGAASGLAVNVWFSLFLITQSSEKYSEVAEAQFSLPILAGLLTYGVFAPVMEELIFRWFLYRRIKKSYGIAAGLVISSLAFGIYHGNLVQGLYGTLLGFLIAWMYEKCESFLVPVLVHSGANVAVYLTVSLPMAERRIFTYSGAFFLTLAAIGLYLMLQFYFNHVD